MQLRLHDRRAQLHDLDLAFARGELVPQAEKERVQRGFGRAVRGERDGGDDAEVRGGVDDAGGVVGRLEVRQEGVGQRDEGGEVDMELGGEGGEVFGGGVGQVVAALDAGV